MTYEQLREWYLEKYGTDIANPYEPAADDSERAIRKMYYGEKTEPETDLEKYNRLKSEQLNKDMDLAGVSANWYQRRLQEVKAERGEDAELDDQEFLSALDKAGKSDEDGWLEKTGKAFAGGAVGMATSSVTGVGALLGIDSVRDAGVKATNWSREQFGVDDDAMGYKIVAGIGSAVPLLLGGWAGTGLKIGMGLARIGVAGRAASVIGRIAGGSIGASAIEVPSIAGETYEMSLAAGNSEEQATRDAQKTWVPTLATGLVTNASPWLPGAWGRAALRGGGAVVAAKVAGHAAVEGLQEEYQAQIQERAVFGTDYSVPRHTDEMIVGSVVGVLFGGVSETFGSGVGVGKADMENQLSDEEAESTAAIEAAAQARTMDLAEIEAEIIAINDKYEGMGPVEARDSADMGDIIRLKVLKNEVEMRSGMDELEAAESVEVTRERVKNAVKIGYNNLKPSEKGYLSIAIESLARRGELDPAVATQYAHQLGTKTGRTVGQTLNPAAFSNYQGPEYAGGVHISEAPDGTWQMDAFDADLNHVAARFDSREEANKAAGEVAVRLRELADIRAQKMQEQQAAEAEMPQAEEPQQAVEKPEVVDGQERTFDFGEGRTVTALDDNGVPKRTVAVGKYVVKTIGKQHGVAALGDAAKRLLGIIDEANVDVQFFYPGNDESRGLSGFFDPETQTVWANVEHANLEGDHGGSVLDIGLAHEFGHWISRTNYDAAVKVYNWIKDNAPEVLETNRKRVIETGYKESSYHEEDIAEGIAEYIIQHGGIDELSVIDKHGPIANLIHLYSLKKRQIDSRLKDPEYAGTFKSRVLSSFMRNGLNVVGNKYRAPIQATMDELDSAPAVAEEGQKLPGGDTQRRGRDLLHRLYSKVSDDLHYGLKILLSPGRVDQDVPFLQRIKSAFKPGKGGEKSPHAAYYHFRSKVRSAAAQARSWVMDKPRSFFVSENGEYSALTTPDGKEVKSVKQILGDHKISGERLRQFNAYLLARRKLSVLMKKGDKKPMTPREANKIRNYQETVKEYDSDFRQAADELNAYLDALMIEQVKAGILSPDAAANAMAAYDFYVPLVSPIKNRGGGGPSVPSKGMKAWNKTDSRPVENPVTAVIQHTHAAARAIQNNVGLIKVLKEAIPVGLAKKVGKHFSFSLADVKRTLNEMVDEGILDPVERDRALLRMDGWDVGPDGAISEGDMGKLPKFVMTRILESFEPRGKENFVGVWLNGKMVSYEVDPEIYKAITNASFTSNDETRMLLSVASKATAILRQGAVLTPEFGMRNIIRDINTATVLMSQIPPHKAPMFFKEWLSVLGQVMKHGDLHQMATMAGALMSDQLAFDRNDVGRMQRDIAEKGAQSIGKRLFINLRNPLKYPIRLYELAGFLTQTGEETTRLAIYKVSLDERTKAARKNAGDGPISWEEVSNLAAMDARDTTIDFRRMGSIGRIFNMLTPFLNAGIQGQDKLFRALWSPNAESKAAAWTKAIAFITIPSLLLHYHNKDEEWYKQTPAWEKNLFWLFSVNDGKTVVRVPKPFDLGMWFGSLPERLVEHFGGDRFTMDEWEDTLQNSVMFEATNMVPPIGAAIRVKFNYDPWTESELVRGRMKNLAPHMQYSRSTSDLFRKIAPMLWKMTDGKVDISPIKADYYIRNVFGGVGTYTVDAINMVLTPAAKFAGLDLQERREIAPEVPVNIPVFGESDLYNFPGLKGFVRSSQLSYTRDMNRIFRIYEDAAEAYQSFSAISTNPEATDEMRLEHLRINGEKILAYPLVNDAVIAIYGIGQAISIAYQVPDVDPKDRRDTIKEYERAREEVARAFMEVYNEKIDEISEQAQKAYEDAKAQLDKIKNGGR